MGRLFAETYRFRNRFTTSVTPNSVKSRSVCIASVDEGCIGRIARGLVARAAERSIHTCPAVTPSLWNLYSRFLKVAL